MRRNETRSSCKYYSWGDVAPRAYGAFCMHKGARVFSMEDSKLSPQCYGCRHYEKRRNIYLSER